MIDRYKRDIHKLVISLGKDFILNIDNLKFVVKELINLGIDDIEFELNDNIDSIGLCHIINYINSECNVNHIGIVTDGFGIYSKISELKSYGLTNISVRLESLKQYKYKKLNHNININEVLDLINKCISFKLNTKIICTLINDFNTDEVFDFINLTKYLPVEVSFSELVPDPNCMSFFNKGYINVKEVLESIKEIHKLNYVNGRMDYYKLDDSNGVISRDTHNDNCSICLKCNEIFLDENGYIKTCINSNIIVDTKPYINKPLMFKEIIKQSIYEKPKND